MAGASLGSNDIDNHSHIKRRQGQGPLKLYTRVRTRARKTGMMLVERS
jgi:hypothetical protein